jgi:hypothetical protein
MLPKGYVCHKSLGYNELNYTFIRIVLKENPDVRRIYLVASRQLVFELYSWCVLALRRNVACLYCHVSSYASQSVK